MVSGSFSLNPSISPDGQKVLFTSAENHYDLVEVPLDRSPLRDLLSTSRSEVFPSWAPGGNEYAFETDRSGNSEIWLRSRRQGWERPLVTGTDFGKEQTNGLTDPVFSPDRQRIAYSRTSGGVGAHSTVWVSAVAGGPPVRVMGKDSEGISQCCPTWSPDGNWIAYIATRNGKHMLEKVKLGTGEPIVISQDASRYAHWSPTGESILYVSPEGLSIISPDGARERVLRKQIPVASAWSKDGKTVYGVTQTENHRIEVVAILVRTGNQKVVSDLGPSPPAMGLMFRGMSMAPDGKSFATSLYRMKGDIWLIEGFLQPGTFWRTFLRL